MSDPQNRLLQVLAEADTALADGDHEQANRLYRQVQTEATTEGLTELAVRATQGMLTSSAPPANNQSRATTLSREALSPAAIVPDDDLPERRQIRDLLDEIQGYRAQRSPDSFKQIDAIYARLLGFTVLTDEERTRYTQEQRDVFAERERFLAQFNELITARQLKEATDELIALRKLMDAGETRAPQGVQAEKDQYVTLDEQYALLRGQFIEKLVRSAEEQADRAERAYLDGIEFLDPLQLRTATNSYSRAISLLAEPNLAPSNGIQDEATRNAAEKLRLQVTSSSRVVDALARFRARLATSEELYKKVTRLGLRQSYDQARDEYRRGLYREAADRFLEIKRLLPKDSQSDLVNSMLDLVREQLHNQRGNSLQLRYDEAVSLAAVGRLDEAGQVLQQFMIESAPLADRLGPLRQAAERLQAEVSGKRREAEEELQQLALVEPATAAEYNRLLDELDSLILRRPGFNAAVGLRDRLLLGQSAALEREVRQSIDDATEEELNQLRRAVDLQLARLQRHSDPIEARPARSRLDMRRDDIDDALKRVRRRQAERGERERVLDSIETLLRQGVLRRHQEALSQIEQALVDTPAGDLALRGRADSLRRRVRGDWESELISEVRQLLADNNPADAAERLEVLRNITDPDSYDVQRLSRRVERVLSRRRGLDAFAAGDLERAVRELRAAQDDDDTEVRAALREAERRYGRLLIDNERYEEAVSHLRGAASSYDPQLAELLLEAQANLRSAEVRSLLADYKLDLAATELAAIEGLPGLAGTGRVRALRQELDAARAREQTWRSARGAGEAAHLEYLRSGDLAHLTTALAALDSGFAMLPPGDTLAEDLRELRQGYEKARLSSALVVARRALDTAAHALDEGNIRLAISTLRTVAPQTPAELQMELSDLLTRVRTSLTSARQALQEEARAQLLGQRLRAEDVRSLIERVRQSQLWDEDGDPQLEELLPRLERCARLLSEVEGDMAQALAAWVDARQGRGSLARPRELALGAGDRLKGQSFSHFLLQLMPDLPTRFTMSQERNEQARAASEDALTLLAAESPDFMRLRELAGRLLLLEEGSLQPLADLISYNITVEGVATAVERTPLFAGLISRMVEVYNAGQDLLAQAIELEPNRFLALTRRQVELRVIVEELDRDDRYGARSRLRQRTTGAG